MDTRNRTSAGALVHVLDVLDDETIRDIFKLAGMETIYDFISIDSKDLKEISFINEATNTESLTLAQLGRIEQVKLWYDQQETQSIPTWYLLTRGILEDFTLKTKIKTEIDLLDVDDKSSSVSSKSNSSRQVLYGVKRTISDYPKLRDDALWLTFNRNFKAIAATHAVDEVLEHDYVPDPSEENEFKSKNTFLYSVFVQSLLTAKSKIPVRVYENTRDGQMVYKDLCTSYAEGTSAALTADQLEESLKKLKADKTWNKPLATFLSSWTLKLSDLETVRDKHYSDDEKRDMLTKAVMPNDELYIGITTAKTVEETVAKRVSYEQFYKLVLDRALTIDNKNKSKQKTTRQIHQSKRNTEEVWKRVQKLSDFIDQEKWNSMTPAERKAVQKKRIQKRKAQKTRTSPAPSDPAPVPAPAPPAAAPTPVTNPVPVATPPNNSQQTVMTTSQVNAQRMLAMAENQPETIVMNARTYTASVTNITYHFNRTLIANFHCLSLIDRGANGGLSGDDVRVIASSTSNFADVKGIADAEVKDVPLSTVAGVLQSSSGPIVGIFHQYAHYGKGHTIHSPLQLESFGHIVDDRCSKLSVGSQRLITNTGLIIPMTLKQGLFYISMHPPSDEELDTLPQVVMTSDDPWDPSCYDCDGPQDEIPPSQPAQEETKNPDDSDDLPPDSDDNLRACLHAFSNQITVYRPKSRLPFKPDYAKLKPLFGWVPIGRIRDTIRCTTQWYKAEGRLPMRRHFKSRFPGANVPRREETVATDTIFSDTPALDDGIPGHGGCTMLQFFCGVTSEFSTGFPMSSETQLPKTVQDFVRFYGAPRNLFSDNAKSLLSFEIKDILRNYTIGHLRSEPYQQNQNPAERRIQDVKKHTNILLDRTGSPAEMWLLCMLYVMDLHNHLASTNVQNHITPIQKAFGYVPDISKFLQFHWWQRVLYKSDTVTFPSGSYEGLGRFVGIANNVGDLLTYHILTEDTNQVIARSCVRPLDPNNPNIRILPPQSDGEIEAQQEPIPIVKTLREVTRPNEDPLQTKLPMFSPEELLGRTFLLNTPDGQRVRAEVMKRINDMDSENHKNIKFVVEYGEPQYEEIISYGELSSMIEEQTKEELEAEDVLYTFKKILSHHGPYKQSDPEYRGSTWNLRIEWEDGTITFEPLSAIGADDPASCAQYALENELLQEPGWKRFNRLARRPKKRRRMMNQAALASKRSSPIYMFGVQVPRNEKEARELDKKYLATGGTAKWAEAEKTEVGKLHEYNCFKDNGKRKAPRPYRYIKVFFVYACKHDL